MKGPIQSILQSLATRQSQTIFSEINSTIATLKKEREGRRLDVSSKPGVTSKQVDDYYLLKNQLEDNQLLTVVAVSGQSVISKLREFEVGTLENEFELVEQIVGGLKEFQTGINKVRNSKQMELRFYRKLISTIEQIVISRRKNPQELQELLNRLGLPLRKNKPNQIVPTEREVRALLSALHFQFCVSSLRKYISLLLETEAPEQSASLLIYWQKCSQAVAYIFLSNHEKIHKLEQPELLFNYLQDLLTINYKHFIGQFCSHPLYKQVGAMLQPFFIKLAYRIFILPAVLKRARMDGAHMSDFLVFHFLQELSFLQQKLHTSFGQAISLVEAVLLDQPSLLNKNFNFEHLRFQEKIFSDFNKENLSRIDLRNIDAYNIVCNFAGFFQFLFTKFETVTNNALQAEIFQFYSGQITELYPQVKTSFDRIFKHSGLPKREVLFAFTCVQKQFKSRLGSFISKVPALEKKIEEEYYGFLLNYVAPYALEQLTPTHRKMAQSLDEVRDRLASKEENDEIPYINAFKTIYTEWEGKMDSILKFSPYSDDKMKKIFFEYLATSTFTPLGFNFYIRIFEPFLRAMMGQEGYRELIHLLTMNINSRKSYIESHTIAHLNFEHHAAIDKFNRKNPIFQSKEQR